MKRFANLVVFFLSIVIFSCSSDLELQKSSDYSPPSVKYKPRLMYPKSAQEKSYTGASKAVLSLSKEGVVENVKLVESTGSDVLDEAAIDYCKKLVFNPALRNDVPVNSRVEWCIQFSILDQVWDPYFYVNRIQYLYRQLDNHTSADKLEIQRQILTEHHKYISNMQDVINFNSFLEKVLSAELTSQWEKEWDSWPLSFLLYHDFIQRFPDFDSLAGVKHDLKNAFLFDIELMENSMTDNTTAESAKLKLLEKVKNFVAQKYPDIFESTYNTKLNLGTIKQYL